jgi:hypothetical protein
MYCMCVGTKQGFLDRIRKSLKNYFTLVNKFPYTIKVKNPSLSHSWQFRVTSLSI